MSNVDKAIIETLVRQHGINLPGIGSLSVRFVPAEFIDSATIRPPHREVEFSEHSGAGYPSAGSVAGYAEWAEHIECDDELLTLNGLGVVRGAVFYPSEVLYDSLNPQGSEPVAIRKHRNNKLLWGILSILLIAAGVIIWLSGRNVSPDEVPQSLATATTTTEVKVESVAVPQTDTSTELSSVRTDTSAEPHIIYHVVAGVFSSEENADKMITGDPLQIGSTSYQKVPFSGGKTLVSAYASEDQQAAKHRMRELMRVNEELWLYAQKISQQ